MKTHVLIVEDEFITAEHIHLTLQSLGYEVSSVVTTGEDAVEYVRDTPPDIILMDIELAGEIDGIEAASQIRAHLNIPLVYLTAYTNRETLERAKITNPYGYIVKPFNDRELHSNIQIALHKHQMEQRITHLTSVLRAIRNVNQLITHEKDRQTLLQSACDILIEARGYHIAWIALTSDDTQLELVAHAGIRNMFQDVTKQFQSGTLSYCRKKVLEQPDIVIINDIGATCADCPLAVAYKNDNMMCARLADNKIYGVLCVSLPPEFAVQEEEQQLFREVAGDIAFALRNLDLDSQRQQAEKTLHDHQEHLEELIEERTVELQHEINEHKKTEYALRESEERFRMISELVSDYAYVLHIITGGGLTREWVTDACTRITGYTPEEIDARDSWVNLVHPDSRSIYLRHRQKFLAGEESVCEYCIIHKNESLIWLRDYSRPIWDAVRSQVVRIVGAVQDITERKQAEEAILLLNNAIETTNVGITISDKERKIIYANPAEATMHGYTVAELIGQDARIFSPEKYWHEIPFHELEHHWERETINVRSNGSSFPVHSISTPVRDNRGEPVGIITVSEDITERKQTEEELRYAKETADAANRAKSEFLANMSHELRTPLNAILGYAQILKDEENLTERQRAGLKTIKTSGDHLLTMINEILDLSKIEAGRLEMQAQEFHLAQFLENIASIIEVRAAQKGLAFAYKPDPDLPVGVCTDEKRLREVLINLLDNAIKYTKKGKVSLRVFELNELDELDEQSTHKTHKLTNSQTHKTHKLTNSQTHKTHKTHKLTNSQTHKTLRFEIEDSGVGMTTEQLEEIFLPFQQVSEDRYAIEGTGLGLAISSKLVSMMGGELQVQSTTGKGSIFWFELSLPVVAGINRNKTQPSQKITGYKGKRHTILVADDDEHNRVVLMEMLFPLGFTVIEAKDGQECIEKMLNYQPKIILLDLRMPVMDGYEAAKRIRNEELRIRNDAQQSTINTQQSSIRTPIIAVSASAFERSKHRALGAGFDDFLTKPFQVRDLLELLRNYLQVEWIYENVPGSSSENASKIFKPSSVTNPLVPEILENLLMLASKSRIKPLLEQLTKLEVLEKGYQPFVEELCQLARDYQSKEIVKRLQQLRGAQLVPLPAERASDLLELARLGIVKELLVKLDEIEQQDMKYAPFIEKLRQLVKNYQFDQVIELLENRKNVHDSIQSS